MERQPSQMHVDSDQARAGSTPNIVRWILGISLVAAIVLMSAIWIFGAASHSASEEMAPTVQATQTTPTEDDGRVLMEGTDELTETAPADRAVDTPLQTVDN